MLLPEYKIAEKLAEWLNEQASAEDLFNWLQGICLSVGFSDEPYLWLLRGMNVLTDCDKRQVKYKIAKIIAQEIPQLKLNRRLEKVMRPRQFLFNLFKLSDQLFLPDVLWFPLKDLLYSKPVWLTGEWYGFDIRDVFRDALKNNQLNKDLKPIWMAMIQGKPTDFISGYPEDGFDGIRMMSASPETLGQPCIDDIICALREILKEMPERQEEFIDRIIATYPKLLELQTKISIYFP